MYLIYYKFIEREGLKRDKDYPNPVSLSEARRICKHLNSVYQSVIWSYEKENNNDN
jgi:hypothetical protein